MISQKYIKKILTCKFFRQNCRRKKTPSQKFEGTDALAGRCPTPEPKPYNTPYTTWRNGGAPREAASTA